MTWKGLQICDNWIYYHLDGCFSYKQRDMTASINSAPCFATENMFYDPKFLVQARPQTSMALPIYVSLEYVNM